MPSRKPRVVHMIPVVSVENEAGWLVLTHKKSAPIAKHLHSLSEKHVAWEPPVKSWWVSHNWLDDAKEELGEAVFPAEVAYCVPCHEGRPCAKWTNVPRSHCLLRDPDQTEFGDPEEFPSGDPTISMCFAQSVPGREPLRRAPPPRSNPTNPFSDGIGTNPFADPPTSKQPPPRAPNEAPKSPWDSIFENLFGGDFANPFTNPFTSNPHPGDRKVTKGMSPEQAARLLGLSWPCAKDAIAPAFKKAALRAHPDRGGSDEAMAKINAARETLVAAAS